MHFRLHSRQPQYSRFTEQEVSHFIQLHTLHNVCIDTSSMHIVVFSEEHTLSSIRKQSQNLGIPIDFSTEPMPVKVPLNDKSGVYWEGTYQSQQVEQTLAFITYLIDSPKLFPAVYNYYILLYIIIY